MDAGPSAVDQIRGCIGPACRCRAGSVPGRVHRNARSHRVTRVGAFTLNEAHTLVPTRTATNSGSASIRHKTMRYGGAPFRQGPGILKMVRLHFEAACTVEGERPRGRLASPHRQLVALPTNMGGDLIVGITGHVQDHLLTNPYVDLLRSERSSLHRW
jgi:hypothetical protein